MKRILIPTLLGMILLAACQPAALEVDSNVTAQTPQLTALPAQPSSAPAVTVVTPRLVLSPPITGATLEVTPMPPLEDIPPEAQPFVDLSIQALVRKTGIPAERIMVVQATAVTWKDASLGCPKPGVDYIRTEVPGYNILLEADGATYNFHTDLTTRVVQCFSVPPKSIYPTP